MITVRIKGTAFTFSRTGDRSARLGEGGTMVDIQESLRKAREQAATQKVQRCLPTGRLKCPSCGVEARPSHSDAETVNKVVTHYDLIAVTCSACNQTVIYVMKIDRKH